MKITFLGTSHGYAEKNRFTSCTLIEEGGHGYVLDAGAPVEALMINYDKKLEDVRGVFITHMHSDHIGNLVSLIEPLLGYHYNDQATCFIPEQEGLDAFVKFLAACHTSEERLRSTVDFRITHPGVVFENDDVKVTAIPTMHLMDGAFPAYAYLFEHGGRRVLFTGDMAMKFYDYPDIVGEEHYDLVVCEMAHCNLSACKEMLKRTHTDRMIITHYHDPRIEGYEAIFREFPFDIRLAYDGMEIVV